jgi:hypothetical protein
MEVETKSVMPVFSGVVICEVLEESSKDLVILAVDQASSQ